MSKEQLVRGLNEDLAHEYQAVIQYIYSAATVSGLFRPTLKSLFESEAQDELRHAAFLADKVVALGGQPTVLPAAVKTPTDVKSMLQAALDAEVETIARYKARVTDAEAAGEIGLKVRLEEMIADETNHKEELERLLRDPRLG